jgi:hypothetical protein
VREGIGGRGEVSGLSAMEYIISDSQSAPHFTMESDSRQKHGSIGDSTVAFSLTLHCLCMWTLVLLAAAARPSLSDALHGWMA